MEALVFVGSIFLFVYLPGRTFYLISSNKKTSALTEIGESIALGIVVTTLSALILRWLQLPWVSLWIIPLLSIFIFFKIHKLAKIIQPFKELFALRSQVGVMALIFVCSWFQALTLLSGGNKIPSGIVLSASHDTQWNVAIANEIIKHVPPQNPAMAGNVLTNHHYFYPLFIATLKTLSGGEMLFLYYKAVPLLVAFLFGASLYVLSTLVTKRYWFGLLTVFLGYFAGSIAYVAPIFLGKFFDWRGNTFFADQPFDQLTNPYSVLGFAFFLFCVYWLYQFLKHKDKRAWLGLTLVGGSLFGFKSFGGVILVTTLSITIAVLVLKQRSWRVIIAFLPFLLLALMVIKLIAGGSANQLFFNPGWLLTEMMASDDKLGLTKYREIQLYYQSIHNWLGLAKIKLIELVIYTVGNLGVRLAGLVYMFYLLIRALYKKDQHMLVYLFLFVSFGLAFGIPLLFNLGGNAYNIIQFTPYALLILVFPLVQLLENWYEVLFKKQQKLVAVFLVMFIVTLAIPVNIKNISQKLVAQPEVVSNDELAALAFLRQQTPVNAVIAMDLEKYKAAPIAVAGLSERTLFVEPGFAKQTLLDPAQRQKVGERFFYERNAHAWDHQSANFLYLTKGFYDALFSGWLTNVLGEPVFENTEVAIYQLPARFTN